MKLYKIILSKALIGLCMITSLSSTYAGRDDTSLDLIGKWTLSDFVDGKVRNQVNGSSSLAAQYGPDSPYFLFEEADGVSGLRFQGGANLLGNLKRLSGLSSLGDPGQSFIIRMTVVPLEKPDGYYSGLFQAMKYGESGLRLLIRNDLKLVVQCFPGKGATKVKSFLGNTTLELGQAYDIEVRYTGDLMQLFVNGQLDGEAESTSMKPYNKEFRIGVASGDDYDFNGIIGEVSVYRLQSDE